MPENYDTPLPFEGLVLQAAALDKVAANADPSWLGEAVKAVRIVAERQTVFTTDDVWAAMETSQSKTHERRAMGAVMKAAQRAGIARGTGTWIASTRPVNHARPVHVWASLLANTPTARLASA